ncbi:MAG: hypothetical protein SPJ13_03640 [Bacteroidales bacterium]|nr:hypothetical protein [Bacteroidales bacterium]
MKRIILSIMLATLVSSCGGKHGSEQEGHNLVEGTKSLDQTRLNVLFEQYHEDFPEATLLDYYKYCFQDYYGPTHLIRDTMNTVQYILSEIHYLDSIGWKYTAPYEPLGVCGLYVRVNIKAVKDGKISAQELANALVKSGVDTDTITVDEWDGRWHEIIKSIKPLNLPNYREDSIAIDALLDGGEYVYHHSKPFSEAYHYGYRLIRKSVFKKELKAKIDKEPRLSAAL